MNGFRLTIYILFRIKRFRLTLYMNIYCLGINGFRLTLYIYCLGINRFRLTLFIYCLGINRFRLTLYIYIYCLGLNGFRLTIFILFRNKGVQIDYIYIFCLGINGFGSTMVRIELYISDSMDKGRLPCFKIIIK